MAHPISMLYFSDAFFKTISIDQNVLRQGSSIDYAFSSYKKFNYRSIIFACIGQMIYGIDPIKVVPIHEHLPLAKHFIYIEALSKKQKLTLLVFSKIETL